MAKSNEGDCACLEKLERYGRSVLKLNRLIVLINACCVETPSKWGSYILVDWKSARSARLQLAKALTETGECAKILTPDLDENLKMMETLARSGTYAQTFNSEMTR